MRKKYGFTLVELVIVIIIMGLLASIALPRLTQSREAARLSEGVQLLKTLRSAQERWKLDHGAYTINNDCSDMDVTVNPTNFGAPTCAADGSVSITRTGGAYTVTASAAEVYSCAPAATCGAGTYLARYLP